MKQRIINTNTGKDTHFRNDYSQNAVQKQSSNSNLTIVGEIAFPQPEPLYRNNMVTVSPAKGGQITNVAYPGAFVDPITGNMHGLYEGPIPGQMVIVGFADGNLNSPYVINRYPYQGKGNTLTEGRYIQPLTKKGYHSFDVVLGHFSGSFLSMNTGIFPSTKTPGSVTLSAMTELEILANTAITLSGLSITCNSNTSIEFNSITKTTIAATTDAEIQAGAFVQIKNTSQSMRTLIDSLFTNLLSPMAVAVDTLAGTTPTLANAATAEQAKWALLLKA